MTTQRVPDSVLFDLDGTLLDTAPDLTLALQRLCREAGQPEPDLAQIRPTISQGSAGMLKAALGLEPQHREYAQCNQRFLELYRQDIAVATTLFPGMSAILEYLEARRIPWGIVTNKPAWLTEPLLQAVRLWERAACVVSGDTLAKCKPEPEPLWHACAQVGVAPARSLYIGDAPADIQAGKRAGLTSLVAEFGYLSATDQPQHWGADGLLREPSDLWDWLGAQQAPQACPP